MRVRVNDIMVGYSDEGAHGAPAVIFVHGFPFNRSMWKSQMEALSEGWRVVACDIRGHGESDIGERPYSIGLFAEDLIGLMDVLKIEKAVLCGLSMGGYIALNAVLSHPERFDALVLSDTQCAADSPEGKEKRSDAIEAIRKNGVEWYADTSLKNFFTPGSLKIEGAEIAAVREMIAATAEETLVRTLHALREREESCSRLQEIAVPVLVLVGEEDSITPPEAARLMQEKIEGSHLSVIAKAGHLSNMENPGSFNKELKNFADTLR
ncbi:alpha/beta fold hydrolase [bacterium]|nr:alpha/beta fold hydrolase [bacterium]